MADSLLLGSNALPPGAVPPSTLLNLLSATLGREVERNELLNVRVRRSGGSTVTSDKETITVSIKPSGPEGPRGSRQWTFADYVRMSAVLSLRQSNAYIRSAVWIALGDEWTGGLVRKCKQQMSQVPELAEAEGDHWWDARKLGKPEHYADGLANKVAKYFADDNYFVFVPIDGTPDSLEPRLSSYRPMAVAWVAVNVTDVVVRCLVAWEEHGIS